DGCCACERTATSRRLGLAPTAGSRGIVGVECKTASDGLGSGTELGHQRTRTTTPASTVVTVPSVQREARLVVAAFTLIPFIDSAPGSGVDRLLRNPRLHAYDRVFHSATDAAMN